MLHNCKTARLERLSVILFYCQILVARIKCYVMLCYVSIRVSIRVSVVFSACRKRRLKGGVRGSLMPRSEVLPRPEQKFGSSFLLHAHRCPPLGLQHRGPEPVPSLETHLKSE